MARTVTTVRTCPAGHRYRKSSDCPVCPVCAGRAKANQTGQELPAGLSAPALRALDHEGIKTLKQLARRTENQIAELHGMGPKGVGQLKEALKARGLAFK